MILKDLENKSWSCTCMILLEATPTAGQVLRFGPPKDGVAISNANGTIPTVNINGVPRGTGLAGTSFARGNENSKTVTNQLGHDGIGLVFGIITGIDDILTSSPVLGNQNVGKAQGVYVAGSADGNTQMMASTTMMEGGEYGDSIGKFTNSCGFAELSMSQVVQRHCLGLLFI